MSFLKKAMDELINDKDLVNKYMDKEKNPDIKKELEDI